MVTKWGCEQATYWIHNALLVFSSSKLTGQIRKRSHKVLQLVYQHQLGKWMGPQKIEKIFASQLSSFLFQNRWEKFGWKFQPILCLMPIAKFMGNGGIYWSRCRNWRSYLLCTAIEVLLQKLELHMSTMRKSMKNWIHIDFPWFFWGSLSFTIPPGTLVQIRQFSYQMADLVLYKSPIFP